MLDAQIEGTKTWDVVHDVSVLCRFVYARETIRPGRAVMHASVSVEYECDVSFTATAAIDAAAAAFPRFTFWEYCVTCYNM